MSNNKNKKKIKGKLPKFNFYWVYGIVAVILISINLFNPVNTGVLKTNYSEFKSFIENRQVRKIEVINKNNDKYICFLLFYINCFNATFFKLYFHSF